MWSEWMMQKNRGKNSVKFSLKGKEVLAITYNGMMWLLTLKAWNKNEFTVSRDHFSTT